MRLLGVFVVSAATLALLGCYLKPAGKGGVSASPPASPAPGAEANPAAQVLRGKEKIKATNDLVQIAKLYLQYHLENNKAPASIEEFAAYVGPDGSHLIPPIKQGKWVVVWNVQPSGRTVVAYEKDPDFNGNHVVSFGDGSFKTLSTRDLQAALKGS